MDVLLPPKEQYFIHLFLGITLQLPACHPRLARAFVVDIDIYILYIHSVIIKTNITLYYNHIIKSERETWLFSSVFNFLCRWKSLFRGTSMWQLEILITRQSWTLKYWDSNNTQENYMGVILKLGDCSLLTKHEIFWNFNMDI